MVLNGKKFDVKGRNGQWCQEADTCTACNAEQRGICSKYLEAWREAGCPIQSEYIENREAINV